VTTVAAFTVALDVISAVAVDKKRCLIGKDLKIGRTAVVKNVLFVKKVLLVEN
jgi:hypothetical protein